MTSTPEEQYLTAEWIDAWAERNGVIKTGADLLREAAEWSPQPTKTEKDRLPMTTALERVARAICLDSIAGELLSAKSRSAYVERNWRRHLPTARIAVTELKQLDDSTVEAMIIKAEELHSGVGPQVQSTIELHRLMLTAALDHILNQGGEG